MAKIKVTTIEGLGDSISGLKTHIDKSFEFVDKRFDTIDKRLGSIQKEVSFLASSSAREFKNISHRFNLLEINVDGIKKVIINGRFDKRLEQLEGDMSKVKEALAL